MIYYGDISAADISFLNNFVDHVSRMLLCYRCR